MSVNRWLPLSGLAFVVLVVVTFAFVAGDSPESEASADQIASFYAAHEGRAFVASFMLAASVPFLVFFAVSLARAVSPEGVGRRMWELVLVGGSLIAGATFLVAALLHFAVNDAVDEGVSGDALRAINILNSDSWIAWNGGLGVMMLGAAGALLASSRGRRWLGWTALVLGIALFIPYADFAALILTGIWIMAMSVMLFRERSDAGSAVAVGVQ